MRLLNTQKKDVTFGKPICKHQALQFMMADMDMYIEAARQTCLHCIKTKEAGLPYSREAAICKCLGGDVAVHCANQAIQILGGYGYSREYPVGEVTGEMRRYSRSSKAQTKSRELLLQTTFLVNSN